MNYLQKKKLAFMSIVNRVKGFIRTITGVFPLTLTNCVDEESSIDYTVYGQSVQDGTPTPDTPVEVESVGEYDEATGKYKIPVTVSGNSKSITTNIYLDEPLHKVGDYADYIDFENGKVVRMVGVNEITENAPSGFVKASSSSDTMYRHYYPPSPRMKSAVTNKGIGLCTVLQKSFESYNKWTQPQIIFGISNDCISFVTPIETASYKDVYNYLSNNGENEVTIYYQLATPTETPITLSNLPTFKGTSIISVDTTIKPSNAEITYYSSLKE